MLRPAKIDIGLQSILMVSVKMIAIFFSFCLFKSVDKFMVMRQTLKKFLAQGKTLAKPVIYRGPSEHKIIKSHKIAYWGPKIIKTA